MSSNIEKRRAANRTSYYKNKDTRLARVKEYRSKRENKDKINSNRRERRKLDAEYRTKRILITRLGHALRGNSKAEKTTTLLGCTIEELNRHLENTAISNGYDTFDINNYSGKEYHIDHVVPCDAFNLKCPFHQKLCFNWSNLQILKADENIRKFNKVI